jgi:class I fructose-bisphosphate aldolase
MVYVHGGDDPAQVAHAARVVAELGADLVKVPYTGSAETFRHVVSGCFAPVVIAGGEKSSSWREVKASVAEAMRAGAAGVCIGRNVFQHHDPAAAISDLRELTGSVPRQRREA